MTNSKHPSDMRTPPQDVMECVFCDGTWEHEADCTRSTNDNKENQ